MKSRKFVAVADNHGDMQDDDTVKAVLNFVQDFKPDIRVHLGDNWDFRNLRRGATDDEKAGSLREDWDAGKGFVREYFKGPGEKVFLCGNHDDRLWQFARSASGVLRDYAEGSIKEVETLFRSLKVKMYPYDSAHGIYQMGNLSMLHGYHCGVGAARAHAAIYGNCLFGHVHTQESSPSTSLDPSEARSIGCLCKRDMDYINAKTGKLRWAQGWCYGWTFENGDYQLYSSRKINGRFHAATDIQTY